MAYLFRDDHFLDAQVHSRDARHGPSERYQVKSPFGQNLPINGFLMMGLVPPPGSYPDLPVTIEVFRDGIATYSAAYSCMIFAEAGFRILERHEPKLWSYRIPESILVGEGRMEKAYYLVGLPQVSRSTQLVCIERSAVHKKKVRPNSDHEILCNNDEGNPALSIYRDRREGFAIWRGAGRDFGVENFCADTVHDDWIASGIGGLKFYHCPEVE